MSFLSFWIGFATTYESINLVIAFELVIILGIAIVALCLIDPTIGFFRVVIIYEKYPRNKLSELSYGVVGEFYFHDK